MTPGDIEIRPTIVHTHGALPGKVWGPRMVRNPELIYILSGMFRYVGSDGVDVILVPDQILFIPVEETHVFSSYGLEEGRISVMHFDPLLKGRDVARELGELQPSPKLVVNAGASRSVRELFLKCSEEFESASLYRDGLMACLSKELWLRMCELWGQCNNRELSDRFRRMLAFLDKHCCTSVSRNVLALKFKMTPEHVNAVFRRELQMTPTEYVHRRRVHRAYRLLVEDNLSVKEVAAQVGFCDQFYFSKIFKKYTGRSPAVLKGRTKEMCISE